VWDDPIVTGVHRIREELAARFDFDIHAMFADLRERQRALGSRLVSPVKSAEATTEAGRGRDSGPAGSTSSEAAPAA
jgi:hypothetical protein